ncbi:hypothetical protein GGS20DRAFT_242269 [Poronia punctata]|nr:hypothetical protein GGS20DRAFT_242269 [Poronia punctata]
MEEIFSFIAPRAAMALPQKGTLQDMLFGGKARQLVPLLAVPVRPQRPLPTLQAQHGRRGNSFLSLPTEILSLVFDYIECIEDFICLGLTNEYLLTLAQPHLDDYYMSFMGTWSGKNIVCVGNKVQYDDHPADLFSAEEPDTLGPLGGMVLLSHLADPSLSAVHDFVDPMREAWGLLRRCKSRGKGKDSALAARGHRLVPQVDTYLPEDQPWILRNLTTKEFVRPEPIVMEYIHDAHRYVWAVGFGEVVALRTCWSSAPSNVRIDGKVGPPRGVWAGHRFDITTLARHERDMDSVGWTDVSDEVAGEISEAWHHHFQLDKCKDLDDDYSSCDP